MLNNKKFNIVLSVLIAIGLWAYVIGETDPTDTRTYRDIPIRLVNEKILEDNGFAVMGVSEETVNVTLTGTRNDISKVDPKEIIASVDLAEAASGQNQLKINYRIPDNVELEDKSLNKITVSVDKRVSREFDIEPEYEGEFKEEEEPITVEMSREKVTVTGAEALVEKVDHISAKVGEGEVSEKLKTIGCSLTPVDSKGMKVEHLELSSGSVQITAELASVKTVPLEVPIVDDTDEDMEKSVSAPKTITIKGKSSELEDISSVTSESVDITGIEESKEIKIIPKLPSGVQISEKSEETLYLKVTVTKLSSKTFTFDRDEIELQGLDEERNAELPGNGKIKVVFRGRREQLADIKKEDVSLSLDLKGLETGTHQVLLTASCGKEYVSVETDPEEIRVIIE